MLPASAGMILCSIPKTCVSYGAPRICGDDPSTGTQADEQTWCSPHLRG